MQTRFTSVGPAIPISELVDVHLMASGQRVFPVEEDGRLLGMVCLRDLRKAERSAWERITARDIMTPASDLVSVSASQDASEALTMLAQLDVNQLPVLEHGKLVGLLRREDVLKWLSVHEARAVARDRMDAEGRRR
jgi:CBS domain-containing protein